MGGVQQEADQTTTHHDPIQIDRNRLLDHAADLDEAVAALVSGDRSTALALVADVVAALHDRLFPHLPDGRSVEEQDLAPPT